MIESCLGHERRILDLTVLATPHWFISESRNLVNALRSIAIGLFLLPLIWATGCGEREQVSIYTVPKEQPAATASTREISPEQATDRMVAAIVPHSGQAWFFKLTGSKDAVAPVADVFRTFLQSVTFSGDSATPKWNLPASWRESPGPEPRFATIAVPSGDESLDLSVSKLAMPPTNETDYLLANINRWRDQLSQPPISAIELGTRSESIELADTTATFVDFVGKASSGNMSAAPFAGGARPSLSAPIASPAAVTGGQSASGLTYDVPAGWSPSAGTSMSLLAFQVRDGGQQVETTVTLAGGDLLPNVNRWRGQIQLGSVTQEQLQKDAKQIAVGDVTGDYVELFGPADAQPRRAILGVMAVRGGTWFITMKGDAQLAEREKQNFEAFVKSIKFSAADGANHGK